MVLLPALSLLSGCALMNLATVKRSHPTHRGRLHVDGISSSVQILRDDLGVPHIQAETENDAWFTLGLVHAQDRLFQADLMRRLAWGDLSEWLGADLVELDLFTRGLNLQDPIEEALLLLSPDDRARIDAYVTGFNAGAASLTVLPIEYRLLGVPFEPWTARDVMSTPALQSWNLAENPGQEALALLLRDRLGSAEIDALLRLHGEGQPTEPGWDALRHADIAPFSDGYLAFTRAQGGMPHHAEASNNWVIGPEHSADGLPIVANDPHLTQGVPSLWYAADIRGGDLHVAGVTLPGTIGVIIGHNERVAWGLTNVMADYVDLAVLERDGEGAVIIDGVSSPLRRVTPTVTVNDDVVEGEMWWTDIGPVISELSGSHVVVLRWHILELPDESLAAFIALNHAGSVQAGLDAFDNRSMVVAQNLVIGDVDGDFAWQQIGSVVKREGFSGRVPHLASDPEVRWVGYYEALPGEHAPERGYTHTANARPEGADYAAAFVPPWRHDRIAERLEALAARGDIRPDDLHDVQLDLVDLQARTWIPRLMEGVTGSTPAAAQCQQLLSTWDALATPDSVGAAVWSVFLSEFIRSALTDELGEDGVDLYLSQASSGRNFLSGDPGYFLDDQATAADAALHSTCTALTAQLGDDPAGWIWGTLHPLQLQHPFAGNKRLLRRWNMPVVPWSGSGSTVAAAGYSLLADDKPVGGMTSMRMIMPLADLGASTLVHPGGQSGHPRHRLYQSHFEAFTTDQTLPLWFAQADVDQHTRWRLILEP